MRKNINQKTPVGIPKIPAEPLPPLIFAAKTKAEEARLAKLKSEKRIRKAGPRLYTSLSGSEVERTVRANWSNIVAHLFPEALLSHRSALEYKPSPENNVILTGTTNRSVKYPGLTLHFIRGQKPLEDDPKFLGFRVSSRARAFLENLSSSKKTSWRVLSLDELESKLNELASAHGASELRNLLVQANAVARSLGWHKEYSKLESIINAMLGEAPAEKLKSNIGRARAQGRPYDVRRIPLFDSLYAALCATPMRQINDHFKSFEHFKNKAFFEAYFSNYIEGTTFEVEEAEEIVFDKKIPEKRPKDAHDILGTFNLVTDANEMKKTPRKWDEIETLLKARHKTLMEHRPEADPGEFKDRPNRVGERHFVRPEEISGTIEKGFARYQDLPTGLPRAIFIMFLTAEVHPFTDGNGRIARIMMNAELISENLGTIIVPTIFREDYISALKALTVRERPDPLIRMLVRAQHFSNLEFDPYKKILAEITKKNWFREPSEAKIIE